MPKRTSISQMPPTIRAWLEKTLSENGFSQFEWLAELCSEKGFTISKSAIGRHSKFLQNRLDAIHASTTAAKLIEQQSRDDGNALGGAVMTMINSQLFDIMVKLQELDEESMPDDRAELLSKMARAVADLNRAMQSQKKFAEDARAKFDKLEAQATKDQAGGKKGLDLETLKRVREQVYGITS
jgi:hypothetical protein